MPIPGLTVDLDGPVPVYRQIADAVRSALREGRLEPGGKLPPTRDLAREVGVNRNTVIAAYDLLASEGLVESHTGRGTFVVAPNDRSRPERAPMIDETADPFPAAEGGPWLTGFSRAVESAGAGQLRSVYRAATSSEGISFAGTYPAAELLPIDEFREAIDSVLRRRGAEVLGYGPTSGYLPLRQTIARAMERDGSAIRPEQVLITNGAQQAISLVFRSLLDRGDPVVLEEPTYTGALSALRSLGARRIGVPVDAEGLRPEALALSLERHRPRLIYVQPTFQNPTTAVMSERRRREVLALAARHRCAVVEDDWAGDLRFEGRARPTLHALDRGARVIYLGTFSKKLLPGLRVGWLAAPGPVIERVVALKRIEDFGTSTMVQAALHRFLRDGGLTRHLERVLPEYRRRRDTMLASLERHFPTGARWTRPEGGLFVWVTLPRGMNANEVYVAARRRGVLFCRGELFHGNGGGRRALRLTYGGTAPEEIESGIAILGELLEERWPDGAVEAETVVEEVPIL